MRGVISGTVILSTPELTPYRTIPSTLKSVEKVIVALLSPERVLLIFDVAETRFRVSEVDPVFPARSVAMTVITLGPAGSPVRIFDHVPVPRLARLPLTVTLAIPPVSDTVPAIVGAPVTRSLLLCDVMAIRGRVVSGLAITVTVRDILGEVFPARSVLEYPRTVDPRTAVFTLPELARVSVPVPSSVSLHEAPGSV